jgi:hypothetical protein
MPTSLEFPFLAEVTAGMDPAMLAHVRQNIDTFSIEVRIDYERWIQYCKEYEDWIDEWSGNTLPNSEKEAQNEI